MLTSSVMTGCLDRRFSETFLLLKSTQIGHFDDRFEHRAEREAVGSFRAVKLGHAFSISHALYLNLKRCRVKRFTLPHQDSLN